MLASRLMMIGRSARQSMVQSVRRSHDDIVYKGQNLPFDITNHRLLAIKMTIFFGIPFAVPFLIVRYQLKKSSGQYN